MSNTRLHRYTEDVHREREREREMKTSTIKVERDEKTTSATGSERRTDANNNLLLVVMVVASRRVVVAVVRVAGDSQVAVSVVDGKRPDRRLPIGLSQSSVSQNVLYAAEHLSRTRAKSSNKQKT
jgi:hypothetical protein